MILYVAIFLSLSTKRVWLTSVTDNYLNVASSEFVVLKSEDKYKNSFIYCLCLTDGFSEFLISNSTGSTNSRQRVKPNVALNYSFAYNHEISNMFSRIVEPYHRKMTTLKNENEKLIQHRDTLLPKLMSGELELSKDLEV